MSPVLPIKIAAVIGPTPNSSVTVVDDAATTAPIRLCDSFSWMSSRRMSSRRSLARHAPPPPFTRDTGADSRILHPRRAAVTPSGVGRALPAPRADLTDAPSRRSGIPAGGVRGCSLWDGSPLGARRAA